MQKVTIHLTFFLFYLVNSISFIHMVYSRYGSTLLFFVAILPLSTVNDKRLERKKRKMLKLVKIKICRIFYKNSQLKVITVQCSPISRYN